MVNERFLVTEKPQHVHRRGRNLEKLVAPRSHCKHASEKVLHALLPQKREKSYTVRIKRFREIKED